MSAPRLPASFGLPLCHDDIERLGEGRAIVRDGALGDASARACAEACLELDARGGLQAAGVGRSRQRGEHLRGDRTAWLGGPEQAPELRSLHQAFDGLRESLNDGAWLGLRSFELQLACYPGAGARYTRHRDAMRGDSARRVTAILYLNPSWTPGDGGELQIHPAGGAEQLEPLLDRLVIFMSDRLEHEVLPAHATRFAVTAWFRGAELLPPGGPT